MEDQSGIRPNIARNGGTHFDATFLNDLVDIRLVEFPEFMRPRRHEERSVSFIDIIQVNSDRNHAAEYVGWRGHVGNASFDGPWSEARGVNTPLHGNCAVLVPGQGPIHLWRFVEVDRANGPRACSGKSRSYGADRAGFREQVA